LEKGLLPLGKKSLASLGSSVSKPPILNQQGAERMKKKKKTIGGKKKGKLEVIG